MSVLYIRNAVTGKFEPVRTIKGNTGEDGGYYTPAVDRDGNLTWTSSKAGMPDIPGANIKGPAGTGGSGSAYTLPIASATQLGVVMPVAKTDEMTQSVGVDEAGGLWTAPGSGGGGNWITVGDVTLTEETSEIRFDWRNSNYPFNTGRIYVLNAHLVGAAGAESELDVKQQGIWPGLGSDSGWLFGNNLYKVPTDGKTKDIVETAIAFEKVLGSGGQVIRFVNGVQSLNTNFDKDRCQGVKFTVSGNFGVGTKYKLMFKDL